MSRSLKHAIRELEEMRAERDMMIDNYISGPLFVAVRPDGSPDLRYRATYANGQSEMFSTKDEAITAIRSNAGLDSEGYESDAMNR